MLAAISVDMSSSSAWEGPQATKREPINIHIMTMGVLLFISISFTIAKCVPWLDITVKATKWQQIGKFYNNTAHN
jgi:hypothetical protein